MKKIALIALSFTLGLVACKKDKPAEKTKLEMLTSGQWKITEIYLAKDTVVALDYYSTMEECVKDNFFTFNSNFSITSDEGATKCDNSVAQTTTDGKWTLSNSDKTFTIEESKILPISGNLSMSVSQLDNSTLKLSKDTTIVYPGVGNLSGTIHATFKKK
jgi:hypothetical protein